MIVSSIRLLGVRCFEDSGSIKLSPGCNIFVGQNNSGKSTLLKAVTDWQFGPMMSDPDIRPYSANSIISLVLSEITAQDNFAGKPANAERLRVDLQLKGSSSADNLIPNIPRSPGNGPIFAGIWPNNFIVPFAAKRKATHFSQDVSINSQSVVNGTFSNLYARIDRVAFPGT